MFLKKIIQCRKQNFNLKICISKCMYTKVKQHISKFKYKINSMFNTLFSYILKAYK